MKKSKSKKKLVKKLIVTTNLKGLKGADFSKKALAMGNAMKANPEIVPDIKPEPAIVITAVVDLDGLNVERAGYLASAKETTVKIIAKEEEIDNMLTSQWAGQVQTAAAGDEAIVKKLLFGIKGQDNGTSPSTVGNASDTHPIISEIDARIHLQHNLKIINSETGKIKLPVDAMHTNIFQQIGGTVAPNDIKKMEFLGQASRGKYTNLFMVEEFGKTVYYIAVYVDKKTGIALEMSPVSSAVIG